MTSLFNLAGDVVHAISKTSFSPVLNFGGCGHFAEIAYSHFIKAGFKPCILALTDYPCDVNGLTEYRIIHVVLKIRHDDKTFYFDSQGLTLDISRYQMYSNSETIHSYNLGIRRLGRLNKSDKWNSRFPRNSIPVIHTIFEKVFRHE